MPFRTEWVDPEVFLEHHGVKVYHTYKNNDIDESAQQYWFSLHTQCGIGECSCDTEKCRCVFDVRKLPTWKEPPHPPFLTGKNDTQRNWACLAEV